MKKLNKKGFVLVETLVTTVFVMSIFAIMYNNFYPLVGEYEKRENYDDVDSKYGVYWIKRIIQDNTFNSASFVGLDNGSAKYLEFSCSAAYISNATARNRCANICKYLNIRTKNGDNSLAAYMTAGNLRVYISKYDTSNFKQGVKDNPSYFARVGDKASGFADYVNLMAVYRYHSENDADYRVTAEFEHEYENDEGDSEVYYSYSTIEVIK